jgi:hypothetical protein
MTEKRKRNGLRFFYADGFYRVPPSMPARFTSSLKYAHSVGDVIFPLFIPHALDP